MVPSARMYTVEDAFAVLKLHAEARKISIRIVDAACERVPLICPSSLELILLCNRLKDLFLRFSKHCYRTLFYPRLAELVVEDKKKGKM